MHSAGIQDRVAARAVLMRLFCRFDSISTVFADGGYTGKLIDWAKDMFDYSVQIVKRTFAWLNWSRRHSKDYEITGRTPLRESIGRFAIPRILDERHAIRKLLVGSLIKQRLG